MYSKATTFGPILAAALLAGGIVVAPQLTSDAQAGACLPTDHIDGSTAAQTVKTMQAAGYLRPHDLKKGCDNYWYARASKDGTMVDVVLPFGGQPFIAHDS